MVPFNTDGLLTEKKKVPQDRRKYIDYLTDSNRVSTYEHIVSIEGVDGSGNRFVGSGFLTGI